MNKRLNSSLTFKLSLPIFMASALILILISAIISYQTDLKINKTAIKNAKRLSQSIVIAVEAGGSQQNLTRVVSAYAARGDVSNISVVLVGEGVIIADDHHANIGQLPNQVYKGLDLDIYTQLKVRKVNFASKIIQDDHYFLTKVSLINPELQRTRAYYLYFNLNTQEAHLQARNDLVQLAIIFALGITCMLIVVHRVQRKVLIKPLLEMLNTIEYQNEMTAPQMVDIDTNDELGHLANSYNALINSIRDHQNELNISQHYIKGITNAAPVLLSYVDFQKKYRFVNQRYLDWFDQPLEHFIGVSLAEVLGEEVYGRISIYVDKALAGDEIGFEAEIPFRALGKRYVQASFYPDIDEYNGVKQSRIGS